ncbi:MAG: tRNA (adenosine(37)-N6)-threonylcarbamoyltransferase complex ATPase subunit type 1 TsaE [Kofleriaceae bacterium]
MSAPEPWTVALPDADATEAVGAALGAVLGGGEVIALCGDLGAGKTTLVRGVAVGAGAAPELVASPTFALVHSYPARVELTHLDLYRLVDARELRELGFDELLDRRDASALVEWADRFAAHLPDDRLEITLTHAGSPHARRDRPRPIERGAAHRVARAVGVGLTSAADAGGATRPTWGIPTTGAQPTAASW